MEDKHLWVSSLLRAIFINDSAMVKVEIVPVGLTKQIVFREVDQMLELDQQYVNRTLTDQTNIRLHFSKISVSLISSVPKEIIVLTIEKMQVDYDNQESRQF